MPNAPHQAIHRFRPPSLYRGKYDDHKVKSSVLKIFFYNLFYYFAKKFVVAENRIAKEIDNI